MCVIIHNRKGSRNLTEEEFRKAWRSNSDGFGLMYVKDSIVEVKKSLSLEESYEIYLAAMAEADGGNVVSHFRFKTHGPVSMDNVHPFPCGLDSTGGQMQLVHNGVLGFTSKVNPDWSDTRIFATALSRFPRDYHKVDEYKAMIEKQLSWDKVLIMDTTGHVEYFGAKGVMVDDGIWASNTTPIVYKPMIDFGSKKSYKIGDVFYKVGGYYRIPKKEDETDTAYFHNGILYDTEYYVNRNGIVCEYEEREDITVQK